MCLCVQRFDVLMRPAVDWGPSPESGRLQDYLKAEQQMNDMPPIARWQPGNQKYDPVHTVDLHTVDVDTKI